MLLIQGGRVLRPNFECVTADILVDGDSIADIVAPGKVKDDNVRRINAAGDFVVPGLVNGHNHAQTNLAKGLFDRYTLETYLNALPWAIGGRTLEDHYPGRRSAGRSWCARAAPPPTTCSPSSRSHAGAWRRWGMATPTSAFAPRSRR